MFSCKITREAFCCTVFIHKSIVHNLILFFLGIKIKFQHVFPTFLSMAVVRSTSCKFGMLQNRPFTQERKLLTGMAHEFTTHFFFVLSILSSRAHSGISINEGEGNYTLNHTKRRFWHKKGQSLCGILCLLIGTSDLRNLCNLAMSVLSGPFFSYSLFLPQQLQNSAIS